MIVVGAGFVWLAPIFLFITLNEQLLGGAVGV